MIPGGGRIRSPGPSRLGWALVLVLVAGAVGEIAGAEAAGDLRIGLPRLPAKLDPATVARVPDRVVFHQLFQGLVEFGDHGDIEPRLATHWSVSRDGLTWTFHLRPDVRFHNSAPLTPGALLTPEVAVASLARHLVPIAPDDPWAGEPAPAWVGVLRGPSAVVREVRVGEPGTVQIHLKVPFSPLLAVLAHPALAIVLTQNDTDVPFLGTGPYRIVERAPGRLLLEAAAASHGAPPRSPRLSFHEVGDDAGGVGGLRPRGPLDVYFPQAPPSWAGLGLQVLSAPSRQMGMLALPTHGGLLAQKTLRRAVAASLDPALIEPALGAWAVPTRALLPPGAWAAREAPPPAHDPARARRLLAEARVVSPALTLLVGDARSGPDPARAAEAIRISLAVSGVKLQVRAESDDAYVRALRQGEGDLALHETTLEVNDAHFALHSLLASDAAVRGVATNVAFYRSPLVDSMLLRASQLAFRPERLRLYHRLQAHVAEELPYIPLYVRLQWALARPTVRDLRLHPAGRHRIDRVWIEGAVEPMPPPPPTPAPSLVVPPPAPPALPVPALPPPNPRGSTP